MAKLWARAGVSFEIDDKDLEKVRELIANGDLDTAREILGDAMLGTYKFAGENYIPDSDFCIAGVEELRDFDF